ncbi:MAG: TRAP transporter small permease [Myxococcales bacterium]|nr:TRAP transporter small permease [Myxococcales bacterium]
MTRALARISQLAADYLVIAAGIGLCAITVIIGWQVFGRYVLHSSPSWSEQAALTLMIWIVFLAAAAGVREGFHIRITIVENALGPSGQRVLRLLSNLVVGTCGVAMSIGGAVLVYRTWANVIPTLGLPRGMAYAGFPIAGVLIVLFSLEKILEELGSFKRDRR